MTRLLEDMSAPRTLCPTKCHSSLGTTSVGGFLSLMSGCSLLHTANQSKAHNPHQAWIQAALNFKMKSGVTNSQSGLCSFSSNLEIRLGEHNIWEPDGTEQHIMSAEFIRHPDYDSRTQDSDIMLIKLSRPAALSSYVRPAVLPSRCASEGTVCQVSGWGNLRPSDEGCKLNCAIRPICVRLLEQAVNSGIFKDIDLFVSLQQDTRISCSAWRSLSWVMTPALMHILSKLLKTWSVLDIWREGRTPAR